MTRRYFLLTAAAAHSERLRERIERLSEFGRPVGGTFADGVSRVAFSDADVAGRGYVIGLLRSAGLGVSIDATGNIWARREGQDRSATPVVFGSHIDSVPSGGNFDGDLGVLGAIEVAERLNEARVTTRRPLEIVVWACEEGAAFGLGTFGSRATAGELDAKVLDLTWNGVGLPDALRKIGGDPDGFAAARIAKGAKHAYLELHIEQGGSLEREGAAIGVVEGIVSIDRYDVTVRGMANHAGTTRMADRQDALLAAARLSLAVNETVRSVEGQQVGTVGKFDVIPNARNVVPGEVRLVIEMRDLLNEKLAGMVAAIQGKARAIAAESRTSIEFSPCEHSEGAPMDPGLRRGIEQQAARLGLRSRSLPSMAGHDAAAMSRLCQTAMIFVPSVNGISHSPKEFTRWEDCTRGVDVLYGAVTALAAK